MRPLFLLVLTLTLAAANPSLMAAPNTTQELQANSEDNLEPNDLFPLTKRNGIDMRVETVSPTNNKNIVRHSLVPSFVEGEKRLMKVIAQPDVANGIDLAVAAVTKYRAGDLKEAAFLFYAARLRIWHDLDKYPPTDATASSTKMFLGLLIDAAKVDLIRQLFLEPKVLAAVVQRLELFDLKEPSDYQPGWDYTKHEVAADLFAKDKASLLDLLKPTSELLLMPEYLQAFRTYRMSNDIPEEQQKLPDVVEGREKAVQIMKRIEKEKNLHGIMFQTEQEEQAESK